MLLENTKASHVRCTCNTWLYQCPQSIRSLLETGSSQAAALPLVPHMFV